MEPKTYNHLSEKERITIEILLTQKKSYSYISIQLKRNRSTITREIKKWIRYPTDIYSAEIAHFAAGLTHISKRKSDKISQHFCLRRYVYSGLIKHLSPELIAGRIKIDHPGNSKMTISYEAIYTHIYNHPQAKLNRKLIKLLLHSKPRRRRPKRPRSERVRIIDAVSIDMRPAHVQLRQEVGHWEGDLMIGVKQSSAIGTLVERKTRYTHIVKLGNRKSETVTKAFENRLNQMEAIFKKTMTYDNGMEMALHLSFTTNTGMLVYFAHPYSSWERGTNENTNGLIRRFLPKGTDFNDVTVEQLQIIENRLNNRPRKVLGFRTPLEMKNFEINNCKLFSG